MKKSRVLGIIRYAAGHGPGLRRLTSRGDTQGRRRA